MNLTQTAAATAADGRIDVNLTRTAAATAADGRIGVNLATGAPAEGERTPRTARATMTAKGG